MSVGATGAYDAVLQDRDINPKVQLGLVLAYSEEEDEMRKAWLEGRIPPLPPRRSSGPLSWSHKDPISDFVFAQDDWSDGAFQSYYRDADRRYAKSDGVDLRWTGVAALGARRATPRSGTPNDGTIRSNFLLANGDMEEGVTTEWTAGTSTTLAVDTDTVRTGNYAMKATVAQGTSAGAVMSQVLDNPTAYRSRAITVFAYVRRSSGTDSSIKLRLADSAGSTDSSAITANEWSYVYATRTIDSGASSVTISIQHTATTSNAAHIFYIDDIHVVPAGGVQTVGKAIRASTTPDEMYVAVGRCVVYWDETDYRWTATYIDASATVTDIEEFNDTIYVAFGEPAGSTPHQYVYGNQSGGWTTAALNGTTTHQENHARFFVKARNGYGQWALWKAGPSTDEGTERHAIAWATDPSAAWNPTSYFTVGGSSRAITGLHEFGDTFVITKVDGIWLWDAVTNDFTNMTQEWEHSVDEDNGAHGQYWHGALYLSSIRQGFLQLSGEGLTDLSHYLMAPRLVDFGGRITAMAAGTRELIIGLDQPTADATVGKTSRLVLFSLINNIPRIHTVQEPAIGRIDMLGMHRDTRMWGFGRSYDSNLDDYFLSTSLWEQPDKVAAPFADVTPAIEPTGFFDTSIWHGGMPETDKALIALTVWCEDLDTSHTIQVDFGRDGRTASDTRLGIFRTSDRIQTLYFKNIEEPNANAVCRFVQLRFTFKSNDTTSPKLYAFALHTQLVPDPIRYWDMQVLVGDRTLMRTGVPMANSKASMRTVFKELEAQIFPLTLIEDFGQAHDGSEPDGGTPHQVRLVDYSKQPTSSDEQSEELWFLRLQEVPVSGITE